MIFLYAGRSRYKCKKSFSKVINDIRLMGSYSTKNNWYNRSHSTSQYVHRGFYIFTEKSYGNDSK